MRLVNFACMLVMILLASKVNCSVPKEVEEQVIKKIDKVVPGLVVDKIIKSPIPGLLQVTAGAEIFYISEDARYLFYGKVLDLAKDKKNWDLTKYYQDQARKNIIDNLDQNQLIVFNSKQPNTISYVTIFTDIDCVYCRKLHKDIEMLNNLGLEVRYVAFPRNGINSKSFSKAVAVWCHKNKQAMLTAAKNGQEMSLENLCTNHPIVNHFELGKAIGVKGTPTIIFANGAMLPSYVPGIELFRMAGQNN